MDKWTSVYQKITDKCDYIKVNTAANTALIEKAEKKLGVKFPGELSEFLLEINGDNWFMFSVEQIIEINTITRKLDCYMPLNCLLFFAGNGCGDYFGYPVVGQNEVNDSNIYRWDHEYDNRIWVASGLEEIILKYYNEEIS